MNITGLECGLYTPLSQEQIKIIHEASLKILERTGITFENGLDDTITLLEENGAEIERERKKIRLPQGLIIKQVDRVPEKIVLCGQEKNMISI